jgi:UrcA family protein
MNTVKILFAVAAVAVSPLAPAVAQEAPSVRIATHDLNLTTAKGQRMLKLRVAQAAAEVCGSVNERFDMGVRIAQRQCREETVAKGLASVRMTDRIAAR